jgi:hypothetical protein
MLDTLFPFNYIWLWIIYEKQVMKVSDLEKLMDQVTSTLDRFRLDDKTALVLGGNKGLSGNGLSPCRCRNKCLDCKLILLSPYSTCMAKQIFP